MDEWSQKMTWSTRSGSSLSGTVTKSWEPHTGYMAMAKVCTVPGKSRMFKGGENIPGDMGEDGVSVVASQSLATRDFTCEINPDLFPCNKARKIRMNVTESQTSD